MAPVCESELPLKEQRSLHSDEQLDTGSDSNGDEKDGLIYSIDDTPPFYLCFLFGLQHYLSIFFAALTTPLLLSKAICVGEDNLAKAELIGTLFTASGIITLFQTTFGVRLPILQAGTFALLGPTLSYFSLDKWKCPKILDDNEYANYTQFMNGSNSTDTWVLNGSPEHREVWQIRMREIQGSIMVAAVLEMFLGLSGAVGLLMRCIGPLTICPTVTLVGLQMMYSASDYCATQWWICIVTVLLIVLFSQYLGKLKVPCLAYSKHRGCHTTKYALFKMFPILLAMGIMWLVCLILTLTNVLPDHKSEWGYYARTDIRVDSIKFTPWIKIPYPGQWGMPSVSLAAVCALISGILSTTIESIGDYHACAKQSGAPPPPQHALNRGIFVEGMGTFLDGLIGTGNGTTSASINIGVLGITRVGSRRVMQFAGSFMVILGIFGKFGALFVTLPEPVIGASFLVLFGMIVAVGLSNLQYVNLNSGRTLFIVGFSIFNGMAIPQWVKANNDAIKTGNETVDNVMVVLLSTSMFVGGFLGFVLDNTIPGSAEERGMRQFQNKQQQDDSATSCYDFPVGMNFIRRHKWLRYLPISPTYGKKLEKKPEMNGNNEKTVL